MLIQTCRDFYENMYVQFHAKYNLTKGVSKIEEGKRKVSVEALAGKWKEVLSVMLYTAFHVHSGKHIENMHIPQRREIITLGLILSYKNRILMMHWKICITPVCHLRKIRWNPLLSMYWKQT